MASWFRSLFRSRTSMQAERAEVEGRFNDAATLYVQSGDRAAAFHVLLRAAEAASMLSERRGYVTRAYAIAPTETDRADARRMLGVVGLAEAEGNPPERDEERRRLREAAEHLEATGAHREAARAYKLLGDGESTERMLVLAGDVEAYEREADATVEQERLMLKRRSTLETFRTMWSSGDRNGALRALDAFLVLNAVDKEVRALSDEHLKKLTSLKPQGVKVDAQMVTVCGRLPLTVGREGDIVIRGVGVSREHAVFERNSEGAVCVRDLGSRNGTTIENVPIATAVPLEMGQRIGLGSDLVLAVIHAGRDHHGMEVERGMDRGRRILVVHEGWKIPLGTLVWREGRLVLVPEGVVSLMGQRVAVPIMLALGDRIEGQGSVLEILG